ncbi:MAG: hypothetical protein ACOCXA_06200 [Planctomycetota bacterium]
MHIAIRTDDRIRDTAGVRQHFGRSLANLRGLRRQLRKLTIRIGERMGWGEPAGSCAIDAETRDGKHVHVCVPGTRVMSAIDRSLLALRNQVERPGS